MKEASIFYKMKWKKRTAKDLPTKGRILILAGLLLLCSAVGLTGYNVWDGIRATREAGKITDRLEELVLQNQPKSEEMHMSMPTEEIEGDRYIGILKIPSLELSLPVMYEWGDIRLKRSPCRYSGSYYTNDLVICGHNYAGHFDALRKLAVGEEVSLTNVRGKTFYYRVTNMESIRPQAVEKMVSNKKDSLMENEWDLTLFTCSLDGQMRWAVRCSREERITK